ncbi:MAG TPA: ABC transporter ATP-binding protein [Acholeplasmataceae bacterium]|nr:ABC transporter ATP-binding protein [Acholeplasmataceae bacterium]
MPKGVKKISDARLFSKLLAYGKKYIFHYIIIFLVMVLAIGASLLTDYLIGDVIDRLNGETPVEMASFARIILIFLGIIIATSILEYFSAIMLQKIGQGVIYNVRGDVFNAIEHYSTSMLKETPAGKLATRVTTDVNTLSEMLVANLPAGVSLSILVE